MLHHLKKNPLFRSLLRFFPSYDTPLPAKLPEASLREQYRLKKHRDEQREQALYAPIVFFCPQGHPYITEYNSTNPYRCLICENASQSLQNEPEVPREIQAKLGAVQHMRATRTLYNRKANEGVMQYIGTEILDTGPLTQEQINTFTHQDISKQETALHEVVVMKKGQKTCDPFLTESPVDDLEETSPYSALQTLRKIAS